MILKIKLLFNKIVMLYRFLELKIVDYWDRHTLGITLSFLTFVLFIALFWNNIFISIHSGQQGIRWSRFAGTQLAEIYSEGLHIVWPWDKVYIYNTRIQTKSDSIKILTAEGLTITVEYTCRFYPIADSIPVIHKKLGENYANSFVDPQIEGATLSIIGNYTPDQLYKISNLVIQSTVEHYLNKVLLPKNIVIDDYFIRKITLPDIVSSSIEKKIVAEQLSYEYDYRLKIEEKEKQRKTIEAKGIRQFEEISKIPILRWKGLEVTSEFAKSDNSKIIIMGTGKDGLPLLLNTDGNK